MSGFGRTSDYVCLDKHRDTLEHHETMMGRSRGRLAVALDLLTDSLALVGQHGVYCRSERFPGKPKMDIALVLEQLDDAKQLVQSAMEELKRVIRTRPLSTSSSPDAVSSGCSIGSSPCRQRESITSQRNPGIQNIAPSVNASVRGDHPPRSSAKAVK